MSQADYARRRDISREAVRQRTTTAGGPIPVHGPRKLIDTAEADRLWEGTKSPQGEGGAEAAHVAAGRPLADALGVLDGSAYARAKTARMLALAQRERLELERLEASLVDRRAAERQVEGLAQQLRDEWRRWPSRVAATAAQRLGVPHDLVLAVLDELVQAQCATLMPAVALDGGRAGS